MTETEDQNNPKLTIITVNYNSLPLLRNSIAAVYRSQISDSFNFWVIDNASEDNPEVLKEEFPLIQVIRNQENLGFAKANNIVLRNTASKYALLLNPDTEVESNAIQKLIDFMDSHPEAGAVGPKLIRPDGTYDVTSKFGEITPLSLLAKKLRLVKIFPYSSQLGAFNLNYLDPNQTSQVEAITGASMMVRRAAIEKAGLLDESYFLGIEDVDWCLRISQSKNEAGVPYSIYYYPGATIVHLGRQSRMKNPNLSTQEFHQGTWLFYQKFQAEHHHPLFNCLVRAGLLLSQHGRIFTGHLFQR